MVTFQRATKQESKLRLALIGPSGAGKTFTALKIATVLAEGGRIAVIDTEHGSASKYADIFQFDTVEPETFSPAIYIDAIHSAEEAGYAVLIIDSLSHAWNGKGGALEMVDKETTRQKTPNSFVAWGVVTPLQNKMIDAITGAKLHIISTMRTKVEYVMTTDDRGKAIIKKVGMQPIQRDGMDFEYDIVGDMDVNNNMVISKTRCSALAGQMFAKPGVEVAEILMEWLKGVAPTPRVQEQPATVTSIDLKNLNQLRLALGVKREDLANEVMNRFGEVKAADLTRDQIVELRTWMSETARAKPMVADEKPDAPALAL